MLWGNAITCTVTHTHTDRAAKRLRHPGCRCQADAASCTAAAGDMRRCRHHRGRRLHLSALQMNAENIFLRLAAAHLTHFGRQFTFSWFLFSVCSPFLILFLFLFFFFFCLLVPHPGLQRLQVCYTVELLSADVALPGPAWRPAAILCVLPNCQSIELCVCVYAVFCDAVRSFWEA